MNEAEVTFVTCLPLCEEQDVATALHLWKVFSSKGLTPSVPHPLLL